MQVNKVSQQNNTSFGIRYLNRNHWNKRALEVFEKSNLLESINKKYPNASIAVGKFYDYEDETHTFLARIKLAKDKNFEWSLSSRKEEVPINHFVDFINTTSLEEVESKAVQKLKPAFSINITTTKPGFVERIKKAFSNFFNRFNNV